MQRLEPVGLIADSGKHDVMVALGDRSYRILIGSNSLSCLGETLRGLNLGKRVALITNPTVGKLYLQNIRVSLETAGFTVNAIEIPDGEEFKNLDTLASIYAGLVAAGLDRGSFIVALGGGVVGDVAGFAAASYLRGIPFVQVPTTLLAQVDSSVGGKTGVNLPLGKNLVGAFYQPSLVMIDVETLSTLPEREYVGGLAEVVKYGIVLDKELFGFVEENVSQVLQRDAGVLATIVSRCCRIKANVVSQDERESGLRAVLNYGHTLGHAVETLTGYLRYTHGEAVAIGMVAAASYSQRCGLAEPGETLRVRKLIESLGLPTEPPRFSADEYVSAILRDKKVRDGGITFVCNRDIGGYCFVRIEELHSFLGACGIGG